MLASVRNPVRLRTASIALAMSAFAVLFGASGAEAKKNGFNFGVAAGDVSQHSAILWAHAKKGGKASVETQRRGTPHCDRGTRGEPTTKAKKSNNFTVQKTIKGLSPGTEYSFRFCLGTTASKVGHFETPPAKGKSKAITFALSGDYSAQPAAGEKKPFFNDFEVLERMRKENNDFNVLLGDTIYSDPEAPGFPANKVALTKKQKWAMYRQNLKLKRLADLRSAATNYSQWDDHEFINNFAPGENTFGSIGTVNIDGRTLYKSSRDAFLDYAPVGYSKKNGIYRSFRWGKNLEIFFLDERSFRSNLASYNHTCDNPSTGSPDLLPTAPQSYRDRFALLVPSLAQPVSQQCTDTINDPNRTMLGTAQLQKFEAAVAKSTAKWKIVMNELPIQQYFTDPYDRWEGYEAERRSLVDFLKTNVSNVIFLSTDVHANLVNEIQFNTLGPGAPVGSGITDITTGPVATKTYTHEVDDATFAGASNVLQAQIFKPQPPDGVGMECAAMDTYSYLEAKVTAQKVTVKLRDLNRKPVEEQPGAPCPDFTFTAQP
jgi:alkaline phosphatase D